MDSKGKKISLILITGIMTVLPLVGRTADSGNLLFLAMLVAISAVMLCVNILNQKNPVRVNIIDLIVLLFCSYVLVVGRESDGDLVYIDPYDGEAYLLDEDLFENCEKIVVRIL